MNKINILIITIIIIVSPLLSGCGTPRLCGMKTDDSGIHFTLRYTAGNWINPANYTDVVTIPLDADGVIDYSKVRVKNPSRMGHAFDGGFVDYNKGHYVDFSLLEYRNGFKSYSQYLGNGRYKVRK